jgi:plastocyanin
MDASIENRAAPVRSRGFLNCGLSGVSLSAILLLATALFLFWNGPLWSAPPGASHMGRIVWSYAIVIPLAAVFLLIEKHFGWVQLASSVGVVWAAKLMVTSSLYAYLATGSVQQYSPAPVVGEPGRVTETHAALPESGNAELDGVLRDQGAPVAGVVVVARTRGKTAWPAERRELVISRGEYDHAIYLATVRDTVVVENRDGVLHNVRARSDRRTLWNVPAPAGSEARTVPLSAGVYELGCDEHPGERATLVVIDREPAAITDAGGNFALHDLPAEGCDLDFFRGAFSPRRTHVVPARAVSLDFAGLDQR